MNEPECLKQQKLVRELSTWTGIANYLGVSIRASQNYEKNEGMPVHRMSNSGKARVWAYAAELDAWKQKMGTAAAAAGQIGSQDSIPLPEKPTAEDLTAVPLLQRPTRERRRIYLIGGFAVFALVLIVAAAVYLPQILDRVPQDFRVEGKQLIALNQNGHMLWHHSFPEVIEQGFYKPSNIWRWSGDLDGDSHPEVLSGTLP